MRTTNRQFAAFLPVWLLIGLCLLSMLAQVATAKDKAPGTELKLAVFNVDVVKGLDAESAALTDQIVTFLSAAEGVTLVNRNQLDQIAEEHKIALSGLVDNASAVRLGKFVSAQYVVVGRASQIGATQYIVLKFIEVETTIQTTVAAKAGVDEGVEGLLAKVQKPLEKRVNMLRNQAVEKPDRTLAELAKKVAPLRNKVFLVTISEQHVGRQLADPAAQLAAAERLQALGFKVLVPHQAPAGWKNSLAKTGKYDGQQVDILIEGEGTSAFAAQLQGLTSCRARVELRAISAPGHTVLASNRGVGARADLVEDLAAKSALEDAAVDAIDALLPRLAEMAAAESDSNDKDADENDEE